MGFVKVVKNKAYFKRYQVKFRRRRECKTDYKQRRKLVAQDKNKYQTPKYRFVVRITNRDISCQIFSSDLTHDECIVSAYSHELKRYGVTVGLTNYSAAYCTGLLLARRVNKKFGLDDQYQGIGEEEADGSFFIDEHEDGRAPFQAFLDIGLARSTTGANIFGCLKGAADGGLHVPHNSRRFPGSRHEEKEWVFDGESAEKHRARIYGEHVADYMRMLQESDADKYQKQFNKYIEAGLDADALEDMYKNAHAQIREDPTRERGALECGRFKTRAQAKGPADAYPKKYYRQRKISLQQRKNRVKQMIQNQQAEAMDDQ